MTPPRPKPRGDAWRVDNDDLALLVRCLQVRKAMNGGELIGPMEQATERLLRGYLGAVKALDEARVAGARARKGRRRA
jgi:hypothetical protein